MTILLSEIGIKTADVMVDIDDVIAPWFDTVDGLCRDRWDAHHLPPCSVWSMWEHYERTQEEWGDVVVSAIQHGLYTTVPAIVGSVEALNRLRWYGHRVHLVTARGFMQNAEQIRAWTPEWLAYVGAGYDTLTFAKDKVAVQSDLGVRFDYAIDDGGHNYEALTAAGVPTWLCKAPHNAHMVDVVRTNSMWDFADMIIRETVPEHLIER